MELVLKRKIIIRQNAIVLNLFLEITAKSIAAMSLFAIIEDFVVSMRFFKRPNALASTLLLAITAK